MFIVNSSKPAPDRATETRHWHAQCGDDDLRVPVSEIMKAQNWLLERIQPDQKIVIIIGEEHTTNMHILLQQALLRELKVQAQKDTSRSFAFGYELNHDFARNETYAPETDHDGLISINAYINNPFGQMARKDLFHYCRENGISVRFNDISSRRLACGYSLVNKKDEFTRDLIERHMPEISGLIIRSANQKSPHGITLSNVCMVEKAIQHMEESKSRIYVQHCGLLHALGDEETYSVNDSLYEQFRKKGVVPLAVLPSYSQRELTFTWDLSSANRNVVKLPGLHDFQQKDYTKLRTYASIASEIDFTPCPA